MHLQVGWAARRAAAGADAALPCVSRQDVLWLLLRLLRLLWLLLRLLPPCRDCRRHCRLCGRRLCGRHLLRTAGQRVCVGPAILLEVAGSSGGIPILLLGLL